MRAIEQSTDAGGGGINVARVLRELRAEAYAVYLAGGATGLVLNELVFVMPSCSKNSARPRSN
jgi:6-phosphofructokinase 2